MIRLDNYYILLCTGSMVVWKPILTVSGIYSNGFKIHVKVLSHRQFENSGKIVDCHYISSLEMRGYIMTMSFSELCFITF